MRARVPFLCLALTALTAAAPAAAQSTYAQARALGIYNQLTDGGCEAALPTARTFWPSAEFQNQLSIDDQQNFLAAVVQCAWSLEDGGAAIEASNAAHAIGAPWADKLRLVLGVSFNNNALAVQAFFDMAQSSPKDFGSLEDYNVWGALRAAEHMTGGEAVMLRMYEALTAAGYQPPDGSPDDYFRLDHARLLLAAGQVEQARARLEGVIDPRAIMTIRVTKLYDPLRSDPAFEQRLDVAAAAEAALARAARLIEAHPRQLGLRVSQASLLRDLGRSSEALAVIEAAAAQAPDAADRYDDLSSELNWLLQERANALYDLGRGEEARSVYGEAIGSGEMGQANVVIGFAGALNAEGRGAEAQQVMRLIGRIAAYGDLWGAATRACAAEQVRDAATRDESLEALRRGEPQNPAALMQALLCTNDMEGARALMIRRLGNPIQREGALLALQPYHYIATRQMPVEAVELQRLAAVRDDPAVRAAIEAVGRVEPTPLYGN